MPPACRLTLLGLVLLSAPGCATVALNAALRAANPAPPWNGEVRVASDPEGARCAIHRGDRVVAEIAATPGTVRLERSHAVLDVRCTAEGHLPASERLRPGDDPAVFRMAPNGIVGATATVISLASARTMRYPGTIDVALPPATFASEAARDQWFALRRDAVLARRAADIALAEERCRAQAEHGCDPSLMVMREEQAQDLAALDALRGRATIAPALAAAN
ncbi:hypothetical protein J5Y09_10390 [Roseomonas sp. PWR1]|uniref:Lipoprotein n=1 Tax=Roseomonas nitratireducens TaxID=2820810 RepID=A0ABS4AUV0_9PROT|nr:hypothetical protein [Neoroseomonas nitratireducens]MBP0464322.1 hypothetical protein [Neoroseomonas nitratireducens]